MAAPAVATLDFSQTIGTTAVQIFAKGQLQAGLKFMRIWNVAAAGGCLGSLWPGFLAAWPKKPGGSGGRLTARF